MQNPGAPDQLQQIHELNRAFLGALQARVRLSRPCLGLPSAAHASLASAGTAALDAAAAFPRALFQVQALLAPRRGGDMPADLDEAEHDLCFSILFAARQTSRQSSYEASLLFGLGRDDIERFCASGLVELRRLAGAAGVVQCAFQERHRFWQHLLTATRPELRRHLALMALQPRVTEDWPLRRPPQSAA